MARPTKYNKELLAKAQEYLVNYEDYGDKIPSLAGLADVLELDLTTVQAWGKDEDKKEFSSTLSRIKTKQHRVGLNKGISGEFNAAVTKLILFNHGYSDKKEVESTNKHKHEVSLSELSNEELDRIIESGQG